MRSKNNQNISQLNFLDLLNQNIQHPELQQKFAIDVLIGLSHSPKWLPCKYIYDEQGSQLFGQIMKLPEYYLTNCETEILGTQKRKIIDTIGRQKINLVELGAGNGEKTRILLQEMIEKKTQFTLIPIDISHTALDAFSKNLKAQIPDIHIKGLVSEYFKGLKWLSNQNHCTNVVLFLGSNIGNFEPPEADVFLSSLWNACNDGDYLLIGFDLKKEIRLLLDAYNDSKGITALFNLNLLSRINRELDGHFNLDQFKYYSTYDSLSGAIKSYLISQQKQSVTIDKLSRTFTFKSWESIHTESSYKYLIDDIEELAQKNGFVIIEHFFDSRHYFVDSLWQLQKK